MIDWFLRVSPSNTWLDGDMVGRTVRLRQILIEYLRIARNHGADDVREALQGFIVSDKRTVHKADPGRDPVVFLGCCGGAGHPVHAA